MTTAPPSGGGRFSVRDTARLYARYTARSDIRPWTAADLDNTERAAHLNLLLHWVDYLNTTYTWTDAHLIPPCWPLHPGLERELTTLYWTYYEAFETEQATGGAAQVWHDRYLPGFTHRMPGWVSAECRLGRHVPRPAAEALDRSTSEQTRTKTHRALHTAAADTLQRPCVPLPAPPPSLFTDHYPDETTGQP